MTRPGPEKVGAFMRQHLEELTRIWRLARAAARPEVFPGLLDGLVGPFFELCGDLLAAGRTPPEAWQELAGLLRWPPALAPGELEEEWGVVGEVLSAACESVNADPSVRAWLERATSACRDGTAALSTRRRLAPPGVVTALVYSPLTPRRARPGATDSVA